MNFNIKDIFYKCIIPEAAMGKINVFFNYSVVFNTILEEYKKICRSRIQEKDIMIPTLVIKNKDAFDELLTTYVKMALNFYDDSNFCSEILDYKLFDKKNMICKEKAIMVHMLANMTYEDFNEPIRFLEKRIDFINNHSDESVNLGHSEILDCDLSLNIIKDTINNETPSQIIVSASNGQDSYEFPSVKFGISGDTIYIYAIQKKEDVHNSLEKKINRKLYKVGEGFVDENIEENPKDITASFLVALNMAINYFKSIGYKKFVVPSVLIVRANSKRLITDRKKMSNEDRLARENKEEMIQTNLTNKLIRTFLRLACHYNNIDIESFPYEIDSSLHIEINECIKEICNNRLLDETGKMANTGQNNSKKK